MKQPKLQIQTTGIVMSEQTANAEIIIMPKAVAQAKKIIVENDIPESYALRVSIKGGGCSGFTYHLGFL